MIAGGIHTVRNFLCNMLLRLTEHPDQLQELYDNLDDTALINNALEEALRHSSPQKGLFRTAIRDTELAGVKIPAGSRLVVMWGSANRDETVFPDPDRFDIHRENLDKHLTFGKFSHLCVGAPLARSESRIALECVLARMPNLHRANDKPLEWVPLPFHVGLQRLDLAWDVPREV
jgi:cytochrome P450